VTQAQTQIEQMLRVPGPRQVRRHLRRRLLAAPVAQLRQALRIALARHDGAHDGHPGLAGHVGDRVVHLHVHLIERLLHPLHDARPVGHQIGALAGHRAQLTDRRGRAKRAAQQPATVQLLQPLAVAHVALARRHPVQLPHVDQHHLDPLRRQQLVHRNPVDAGALHGHRPHPGALQPLPQRLPLRSGSAKGPHGRRPLARRRRTHPVLAAADIDPRHVRLDHRQCAAAAPR